jgi:hypothetical protein
VALLAEATTAAFALLTQVQPFLRSVLVLAVGEVRPFGWLSHLFEARVLRFLLFRVAVKAQNPSSEHHLLHPFDLGMKLELKGFSLTPLA